MSLLASERLVQVLAFRIAGRIQYRVTNGYYCIVTLQDEGLAKVVILVLVVFPSERLCGLSTQAAK